jgi:hypothetical protein
LQTSSQKLFSRALKLNLLLSLVVAVLGSILGNLFFGLPGVYSSLIGAGVSAVFGAMTIGSIRFGSKLGLNGFYALVLGGWLLKVLLFALLLGALQGATFISGPMFFFAVVTSVLGGLAIDSYVVLNAKVPVVEN